MAGGKLTARQKMINMMYLVLTALLALNISKEVLHAFVVVNIGLLQQKANIEQKNAATIDEFQNQVTIAKNDQKIAGYRDEALEVAKLSKELNEYIEQMKIQMVMATDAVDETKAKERVENPFKVERKDDYDRTTNFFGTSEAPGDKGKAAELKGKLIEYKKQLLSHVKTQNAKKKADVEKNLSILNLDVPKEEEHKGSETQSSWEMFYFYHQPQSAALVELTKWQNIVRGAESEILTYLYDQISATAFKFDAVLAAIIPKSNFVTSGSMFEADVFLAAYSSSVKPKIVYGTSVDSATGNVAGGQELTPDKFTADGRGHISVPASGAGERTCEGMITMTHPVTGKEDHYPFRTKYNVAPPSATVSATKMNVMYRGLDNPIEVSVPGVAPNNISVNISGGSMSGGNGKYIVKPGAGKEITISVGAKSVDGKSTSMGSYKFRVKSVPTPLITWAGQKTGGKVAASAASGNPLIPKMEDFDFDVYSVINSFSIAFSLNGSYFAKNGVNGNQIPNDISSKIRTLPKGTKIYFDDIKITVPGGERRTSSAVFSIQ